MSATHGHLVAIIEEALRLAGLDRWPAARHIAVRLGTTPDTVYSCLRNWRGGRNAPRADTVVAWLRALDAPNELRQRAAALVLDVPVDDLPDAVGIGLAEARRIVHRHALARGLDPGELAPMTLAELAHQLGMADPASPLRPTA